ITLYYKYILLRCGSPRKRDCYPKWGTRAKLQYKRRKDKKSGKKRTSFKGEKKKLETQITNVRKL
uniref:Uncharacterized protein n=1 Tax=Accipiter nisus TaxID=211598 RepID=A0A8B9M1P8_9AVES